MLQILQLLTILCVCEKVFLVVQPNTLVRWCEQKPCSKKTISINISGHNSYCTLSLRYVIWPVGASSQGPSFLDAPVQCNSSPCVSEYHHQQREDKSHRERVILQLQSEFEQLAKRLITSLSILTCISKQRITYTGEYLNFKQDLIFLGRSKF